MPNFLSSLFPKFDAKKEEFAAVVKVGQYAIGYGAAITIAKAYPVTAPAIGFALGLELAPSKGIRIKPAAVPLLYAPQPVGFVPPRLYGLPETIGNPLKFGSLLLEKDRDVALANAFADDDLRAAQTLERERQFSLRTASPYTLDVIADLKARRIPRPPSLLEALDINLDSIGRPATSLPDSISPTTSSFSALAGNAFSRLAGIIGAAEVLPGTVGSLPIIEPPQPATGTDQVVGQIQRLDRFGRANPPDP